MRGAERSGACSSNCVRDAYAPVTKCISIGITITTSNMHVHMAVLPVGLFRGARATGKAGRS